MALNARARLNVRAVVSVLLFVALVVWVQWQVGWSRVFDAWSRVHGLDVFVVLAFTAVGYGARALRLAEHFGSPLRERPWTCLRVMAMHNAANNLLPMRTGELVFPLLLKQEFGVGTARSVASLLWLRALDVLALLFAVALTLGIDRWGPFAAGLVALALGIPFVVWIVLRREPSAPRFAARVLALLRSGLPADPGSLLRTQIWTLVHWGSKLAAYAWLVARLGEVPAVAAVLAAVAGEATSVLPVHGLAGAGTYEAGVLAVLKPMGVPLEAAVQAAVNLHLFLLGISVLAAAVALAVPRRTAVASSRP